MCLLYLYYVCVNISSLLLSRFDKIIIYVDMISLSFLPFDFVCIVRRRHIYSCKNLCPIQFQGKIEIKYV